MLVTCESTVFRKKRAMGFGNWSTPGLVQRGPLADKYLKDEHVVRGAVSLEEEGRVLPLKRYVLDIGNWERMVPDGLVSRRDEKSLSRAVGQRNEMII